MDDDMIYYAKSPNPQGYQQTVKEHLLAVAELAQKFGTPMGLATAAELAGQTHDFGKYSQAFQEILSGTRSGVDHAMGGACYLEAVYRGSVGARPVIEAVNGHHNGLVAYDEIRSELHAVADPRKRPCGNGGKTPSKIKSSCKRQTPHSGKTFLPSNHRCFPLRPLLNWSPCCIPGCCFPVWWTRTIRPLP